jgi:hypothetical protein
VSGGQPFPFLIDPARSWTAVEGRLAGTTDERHRRLLQAVIVHLQAETAGDLAGMLASVVPDPRYHLWHQGVDRGPKGAAALAAHYTEVIENRRGIFEFCVDRIGVDHSTVVTEGTFYMCYSRALAARVGFAVDGAAGGDGATGPDRPYLCPVRAVVVWPFDADAGLVGEDVYATFDPSAAVALPEELIPDQWRMSAGTPPSPGDT